MGLFLKSPKIEKMAYESLKNSFIVQWNLESMENFSLYRSVVHEAICSVLWKRHLFYLPTQTITYESLKDKDSEKNDNEESRDFV